MCNLSDGIEARGIEQGIKQGIKQGIASGMARGEKKGIFNTLLSLIKKGKLTVEEAAEEAGMSIAEFNKAVAAL